MRPTGSADKTNRNPGGAPKGNMNALKHGAYSRRLIADEDRRLYNSRLSRLRRDFPDADDAALQEAALCAAKLGRALDAGSADGFRKMDSRLRNVLSKIRHPVPEVREDNAPKTVEDWMDCVLANMKSANGRCP